MSRLEVDSPLGPLTLDAARGALCRVWLPAGDPAPPLAQDTPSATPADQAVLDDTARQLAEYFAGARTAFALPLDLGGTPFQRRVWEALLTIPYGATWSYSELALAIGQPRAVRAVGLANGANPLAIVVACHRVIGSNGRLTGYGGGLPAKRYLLDLERSVKAGRLPGEFALS
jgi:methylated-DNA-[protein]-cysteine S-methyltransferase